MAHSRSRYIVFSQLCGVRPLFLGVSLDTSLRDILAGVDELRLSRWPVHLRHLVLIISLQGNA